MIRNSHKSHSIDYEMDHLDALYQEVQELRAKMTACELGCDAEDIRRLGCMKKRYRALCRRIHDIEIRLMRDGS